MHIHLDMMGGIAGDMFLAAAYDAGLVDLDALQEKLRTLGLGTEVEIVVEKIWRGAMTAQHVKFANWDPDAESDHRHLSTILEMIKNSGFSDDVKETASVLFTILGKSEAKVHGIPLETVHFHEVGAVDSILDFLSAAWIIHRADATWSIGDVPFGQGTIITAHGEIPLPAPATADLLRGFQLVQKDVVGEMVTPTGAAILKMIEPSRTNRGGRLKSIGYGGGTKDIPNLSNVVRMMIFENEADVDEQDSDHITKIETEIDDMNPEMLASVTTQLFDAGALDVLQSPVYMKKGRLGTRLSVLCRPETSDIIVEKILKQTSSFGVRKSDHLRIKLKRKIEAIETKFGKIRVKVGFWGDEIVKRSPEFEDCAVAARTHNVGIARVYEEILRLQ